MKSQLDSLKITRSHKALLDIHFLKMNVANATIFTIVKKYFVILLFCYTLLLIYSALPDTLEVYVIHIQKYRSHEDGQSNKTTTYIELFDLICRIIVSTRRDPRCQN